MCYEKRAVFVLKYNKREVLNDTLLYEKAVTRFYP